MSNNQNIVCYNHQNKKAKNLCNKCNKFLCNSCVIESHSSHISEIQTFKSLINTQLTSIPLLDNSPSNLELTLKQAIELFILIINSSSQKDINDQLKIAFNRSEVNKFCESNISNIIKSKNSLKGIILSRIGMVDSILKENNSFLNEARNRLISAIQGNKNLLNDIKELYDGISSENDPNRLADFYLKFGNIINSTLGDLKERKKKIEMMVKIEELVKQINEYGENLKEEIAKRQKIIDNAIKEINSAIIENERMFQIQAKKILGGKIENLITKKEEESPQYKEVNHMRSSTVKYLKNVNSFNIINKNEITPGSIFGLKLKPIPKKEEQISNNAKTISFISRLQQQPKPFEIIQVNQYNTANELSQVYQNKEEKNTPQKEKDSIELNKEEEERKKLSSSINSMSWKDRNMIEIMIPKPNSNSIHIYNSFSDEINIICLSVNQRDFKFPINFSILHILPYLYISGGKIDEKGSDLNTLNRYKRIEGDSFEITQLNNMKDKRSNHTSVYIPNKKSICFISGTRIKSCEMYNLETNTTKAMPILSSSREKATACLINDSILYVFFGFDRAKSKFVTTLEKIDLNKMILWEVICVPGSPNKLKKQQIACIPFKENENENILLVGGTNLNKNPCNEVLLFNSRDNTIEVFNASLPQNANFANPQFIPLKLEGKLFNFSENNYIFSFDEKNKQFNSENCVNSIY